MKFTKKVVTYSPKAYTKIAHYNIALCSGIVDTSSLNNRLRFFYNGYHLYIQREKGVLKFEALHAKRVMVLCCIFLFLLGLLKTAFSMILQLDHMLFGILFFFMPIISICLNFRPFETLENCLLTRKLLKNDDLLKELINISPDDDNGFENLSKKLSGVPVQNYISGGDGEGALEIMKKSEIEEAPTLDDKSNAVDLIKPANSLKIPATNFKQPYAKQLFYLLQPYFDVECHVPLKQLLFENITADTHLKFNGQANQLVSIFDIVHSNNLCVGFDHQTLAKWIVDNFSYCSGKKASLFKYGYCLKVMCQIGYECKKTLIKVEKVDGELFVMLKTA